MSESFSALFASRKTIAVCLATAAATALCIAGRISPEEAIRFAGALTGVLVLAIAHEDAALKRNEMAVEIEQDKRKLN